jgi:hypothetical protein
MWQADERLELEGAAQSCKHGVIRTSGKPQKTYADEAAFRIGATERRLRIDLGMKVRRSPQLLKLWHRASADGHRPARRLGIEVEGAIDVGNNRRRVALWGVSRRVRVDGRQLLAWLVRATSGKVRRLRVVLACR